MAAVSVTESGHSADPAGATAASPPRKTSATAPRYLASDASDETNSRRMLARLVDANATTAVDRSAVPTTAMGEGTTATGAGTSTTVADGAAMATTAAGETAAAAATTVLPLADDDGERTTEAYERAPVLAAGDAAGAASTRTMTMAFTLGLEAAAAAWAVVLQGAARWTTARTAAATERGWTAAAYETPSRRRVLDAVAGAAAAWVRVKAGMVGGKGG